MIIVSDTSPITSLLSIGRVDILHLIFGSVIIPDGVRSELMQFHSCLPPFIICRSVVNSHIVDALCLELDRGESEAIALAKELDADFVLMDEAIGRRVAKEESVNVIGLVGVLLIAKQRNVIQSLSKVFDDLQCKAGFYLAESVRTKALEAAGELY